MNAGLLFCQSVVAGPEAASPSFGLGDTWNSCSMEFPSYGFHTFHIQCLRCRFPKRADVPLIMTMTAFCLASRQEATKGIQRVGGVLISWTEIRGALHERISMIGTVVTVIVSGLLFLVDEGFITPLY